MKKILYFTLILAMIFTLVIYAAPGDANDPIVVLSYLNDRIKALISDYKLDNLSDLQKKVDELAKSGGSGASSAALEVVEIRAGERLIAGAGTELILRGGKAFVIGSEMGGIANVTSRQDFCPAWNLLQIILMMLRRERSWCHTRLAIFMVRGHTK